METPWVREFVIDGVTTRDETHRTALIQYFATIAGQTFLDVGAADGYESRAVAMRGAAKVVAIEADVERYDTARAVAEQMALRNLAVVRADARLMHTFRFEPFDVVLCFGLLYHMQNPFNFLKRLRLVTKGRLLLETHVAPARRSGLLPKHAAAVPIGLHRVTLDGVPFEGKMMHHRQGGYAPWTFWLTPESLMTAVVRAGFSIAAYYHELDASCPEILQKRGAQLGFGHANTKVWIVADALASHHVSEDDARRFTSQTPTVLDGYVDVVRGPAWYERVAGTIARRL